jgi:hypothetical protein
MAESPEEKIETGKLDLVPMIDCIMLLLLFFILTTRFTSEEQAIASMLPTDKGTGQPTTKTPVPKQEAKICIYPAGFERGLQPSQYLEKLKDLHGEPTVAWMRIGDGEPLEVDLRAIHEKGSVEAQRALARVHAYIAERLSPFESGDADRTKQPPVTIHCFSGMPWAYALVAYDGCRAYEAAHVAGTMAARDIAVAREVDFAPPRIRDYSPHELGDELFEIVHLR